MVKGYKKSNIKKKFLIESNHFTKIIKKSTDFNGFKRI